MKKINIKVRLSTLWIVVMMNLIFADILSLFMELAKRNTLDMPSDVETMMAVAAVITSIPILMIYFSRILEYKANRIVNIVAAIITIIYVIGGGSMVPHYIIIATIEVILLVMIIVYSKRWGYIEGE